MKQDFDIFFKANERRIHFQIHRLGISEEWYGEFYAEGMFALWKAYKAYQPDKGAFGTFLNYKIRYQLIDLLRKKLHDQNGTEKVMQENITQLDNGNRHRGTGVPIVHIPEITLKDPSFWKEIRKRLTDKQWKWVEYFIIADLTVKEIMELENVTKETVKSWGKAVRKKLRDEKLRKILEGRE